MMRAVWMACGPMLAALPEPPVPGNGSYSHLPGILGNDVFNVALIGAAIFLLLGGSVWLNHRLKRGRSTNHARKGGRRRRRGQRSPTLADVGGLPPMRNNATPNGGSHADK